MANVTIKNAAVAGAMGALLQGRNRQDATATDYAQITNIAAAIATAVDTAITTTSTAVKEADVANQIVQGYYSGRAPTATSSTDPGYVADAANIFALWTEAITKLS